MAAKSVMTWHAGQRRWFKRYKGKTYCVSAKQLAHLTGCKPTESASAAHANDWWSQERAELSAHEAAVDGDSDTHLHAALRTALSVMPKARRRNDLETLRVFAAAVDELQKRINSNIPVSATFDVENAEFSDDLPIVTEAKATRSRLVVRQRETFVRALGLSTFGYLIFPAYFQWAAMPLPSWLRWTGVVAHFPRF